MEFLRKLQEDAQKNPEDVIRRFTEPSDWCSMLPDLAACLTGGSYLPRSAGTWNSGISFLRGLFPRDKAETMRKFLDLNEQSLQKDIRARTSDPGVLRELSELYADAGLTMQE
jgi:hypothetical protein